jgi:hypothetical protein
MLPLSATVAAGRGFGARLREIVKAEKRYGKKFELRESRLALR